MLGTKGTNMNNKLASRADSTSQLPTWLILKPTVLGATWAHNNTMEIRGTDPAQSGIIRVKPRIDAYVADGGKKIGEFTNRDGAAEYRVERYQGAPSPKEMQGFYDERIKPGNNSDMMIQFLADQMHKHPGGIFPASLEPMILDLLPIIERDSRFADLNLKIGIMFDKSTGTQLDENIGFQRRRAAERGNKPEVLEKNAANYAKFNNLAKLTLMKNPGYHALPYGQTTRSINGREQKDIPYFSEAMKANRFILSPMTEQEKQAKGPEQHEIFVADPKDLLQHYPKPEKGEWPEYLKAMAATKDGGGMQGGL